MKQTQRREATVTPFLPPYNKCERQAISAANLNRTWKIGNPEVKQKNILIFGGDFKPKRILKSESMLFLIFCQI